MDRYHDLCHCGGKKDKRSFECKACDQPFVTERSCTRCGEVKPIAEFRVRTRVNPRPRSTCKSCERVRSVGRWATMDRSTRNEMRRSAAYKLKHRPRERRRKIIRLFGEDVWLKVQSATSCEICGDSDRLVPDHSHTKGHFRGILCNRCNLAVGLFKDDAVSLRKAARYLSAKTDVSH